MTMSTQTLREASAQLARAVLVDNIQILDVAEPVTVGTAVTRATTPVGEPIAGLVQTTNLNNAIESRTDSVYSIKVAKGTALLPGQAVRVLTCTAEPELVGLTLLVDKVSQSGLSMIRKAVASYSQQVNQQGKAGLA